MKKLRIRLMVFFLGASVLLLALGIFNVKKPVLEFDPFVGRAILPPVKIPTFSLTDHRGQPYNNNNLAGHWTLAIIGFTYCPDVCPTTLLQMADFYKQLESAPGKDKAPEFVFLSVDPFRDIPDELGKYVAYFHKSFLGVTGEPLQIKKLVADLGLYYAYTDPEDDHILDDVLHQPAMAGYGVVHSSAILFISPQAELVAIMTPPFKSENILFLLRKLRTYYGG